MPNRTSLPKPPNPGNYNLQTDEGKRAYNKIVDDHYKALGFAYPPVYRCTLFEGCVKSSAMSFKFTSELKVPVNGKYDATGKLIRYF